MDDKLDGAKNFHTSSERDFKSGEAGKGERSDASISRRIGRKQKCVAGESGIYPARFSDSSLFSQENLSSQKTLTTSSNNIQVAVYEFIAAYTNIERNCIIKGWQAASLLPTGTENYAVFTVINERRRGTNVEEYDPANEKVIVTKSNMIDIQIDIVAETNRQARENAAMLETMSRSSYGVDFFKNYNIGLLYADDARAMETVSKTDNFINRYMLTLHVEEISGVEVKQEYFDKVEVNTELVD